MDLTKLKITAVELAWDTQNETEIEGVWTIIIGYPIASQNGLESFRCGDPKTKAPWWRAVPVSAIRR